jgi:HSP20 family protein
MIYRRYTVPPMWEELDRVQREMSRWMRSASPERGRASAAFPAINAWTSDDEEVVTAELPGVDPDQIDLSVSNDMLTISGESKSAPVEEGVRYHRRERLEAKFSRSIQLAFPVVSDKVTATYENGVLTVTLPRAEEDKPHRINVKAS